MRRRNSLDIMADILGAARGGSKKTWIVYKANLNFNIFNKYLSELTKNGLLMIRKGSVIYETTEKGIEFLKQYDRLREYRESKDLK